MATKLANLTEKQRKFLDYYAKTCNDTNAVIAGFDEEKWDAKGTQIFEVEKEIADELDAVMEKCGMLADATG